MILFFKNIRNFFSNNRSQMRKSWSIVVGIFFLSLLVNISVPSLHQKLHEAEHSRDQHSKNENSADHSDTCHFCQIVYHFASDTPTLSFDPATNLLPQDDTGPQDNPVCLSAVLGTAHSRAPPLSLS